MGDISYKNNNNGKLSFKRYGKIEMGINNVFKILKKESPFKINFNKI